MTIRIKPAFGFAGLSALFFAGTLQAQVCSTATTAGKYFIVCDGYLTPAPNAPLVPARLLATSVSDFDGQIKGTGTISIGGQIVSQVVSGKEKVNSDCTGTVTYTQSINGQTGPPLNFTFVISDFGNRVDGISTDPGAVLSCVLRRTSFSIAASVRQPASVADPNSTKMVSTRTRIETASWKELASKLAQTTGK